jgi:rhodanese-related sulfurtransferase
MKNIGATELAAWLADASRPRPRLLDVREPWEFDKCHIAQAQLLPLRELPARLAELDQASDTVVICHHGGRSMQAALFLERQGFNSVFNLAGGVDAWARTVDKGMPVY